MIAQSTPNGPCLHEVRRGDGGRPFKDWNTSLIARTTKWGKTLKTNINDAIIFESCKHVRHLLTEVYQQTIKF